MHVSPLHAALVPDDDVLEKEIQNLAVRVSLVGFVWSDDPTDSMQ